MVWLFYVPNTQSGIQDVLECCTRIAWTQRPTLSGVNAQNESGDTAMMLALRDDQALGDDLRPSQSHRHIYLLHVCVAVSVCNMHGCMDVRTLNPEAAKPQNFHPKQPWSPEKRANSSVSAHEEMFRT